MKAQKIENSAPGGDRIPLAQLVPLNAPLLVQFFPIYACNFKCRYCTFSIDTNNRGFISDKISLDFNLYKKCLTDLIQFKQKIKVLRFVGMGEPLLHKQLPQMIKLASEASIFERIEILTNGSLLTPDLSNKLINSGLTKLLISIQGTNTKKYKEISSYNIDFEQFIKNIEYFYNNKKETKVHIKIIDCALDGEEDKNKFFDIFGNICDSIGIEYSGPIYPGVAFNNELNEKNKTQFGLNYSNVTVCSQPFFSMQINPDGKVVPCYSIAYPEIIGDCNNESLVDIWNGYKLNQFRLKMLDGIKNCCSICKNCDIIRHRFFKSDDLSGCVDKLKEIYST